MNLKNLICFVICILFIDSIFANSDIHQLKRTSSNNISTIKNKFLVVKKKIISPFNKEQFPYGSFLDSLNLLAEKLDKQRKNMFSDLVRLDIKAKEIQFFDNLNKESILLYNIIIRFRRIYYNYLIYNKINGDYSFKEYTLEIDNLMILERELFSKKHQTIKEVTNNHK